MKVLNLNREIIKRIKLFYKRSDIVKINYSNSYKSGVLIMNCRSKIEHLHIISFTENKRFANFTKIEFTIRFNKLLYYQYVNEVIHLFNFISFYLKNNKFVIKEKTFFLFPISLMNKFKYKGFYLIEDAQLGIVNTKFNEIVYMQIILINELEFNEIVDNDYIENGELYLKKLKNDKNRLFIH